MALPRRSNLFYRSAARIGFAVLATAVCLWLMWATARIGFSQLLARYAVVANSLPAADEAVQLTPTDPNAHRARAIVLTQLRMPADAKAALERATSLRDRDDYLWLELGNAREELGDSEGALAAFDQAVRWAPYYGHTHWQRGNLLLRMGRYDEAFEDLRQAARSNPKFFPNLIDLAWGLSGGDTKKTEDLLQISNDDERRAFASFLARKYDLMFAAKARDQIVNSGFEDPVMLDTSQSGWIVSRGQSKTRLAVDVSEKFAGQRSLQVSFDGESNTGELLLSQRIKVEPGRRYRLRFFVKTKELLTGGALRIVLTEVSNSQILGKSEPFPQSTNSWQEVNVEFTARSEVVEIRLARDSCSSSPCPIFGVAWLDEFSLQKL